VASAQFSKLLATVPLLAMVLSASAVCQQSEPAPVPAKPPRIDFSKARAFPHIFAPYYAPFVPAPQLDNSRRLCEVLTLINEYTKVIC
jgi:hypothetical protein